MKSTILITGVAGFIGSHLAEKLLNLGYSVIGVDNLSNGFMKNMDCFIQNSNFTFIENDFEETELSNKITLGFIFHLASGKIPRDINDSGLKTISSANKGLEWISNLWLKHKCRLIYISTSEVYGPLSKVPFHEDDAISIGLPSNKRWVYAASKLHSEHFFAAFGREYGLEYTIARLFSVYGPRQHPSWMGGVQSAFIENIKSGKPLEIHGSGKQKRVFTFIDDAINALKLMMEKPDAANQIFNIQGATDDELSIIDLAHRIIHLLEKSPKKYPIIYNSDFYPNGTDDIQAKSASTEKAFKLLGWKASTHLNKGLMQTVSAK